MKMLTDNRRKLPIPVQTLPPELSWINSCTSRDYYNALWATLVQLKPRFCLELGTFQYYSAKIFSHYFSLYIPDGFLITCDISTWNRDKEPPGRVFPIMVYPHRTDIDQFHGNINIYHSNYKQVLNGKENSGIINSIIIHEEMDRLGVDLFDFTFVDAGHDNVSALADLDIAKNLTRPNGWILIDDITNSDHDLKYIYPKLCENNTFYTYDNWSDPNRVDMALIRTRKFNVNRNRLDCGDRQA